jgi:hypothetical protein
VNRRAFWESAQKVTDAAGNPKEVTVHNFLSTDERVPVTLTRTNSGRAVATNAMHGHVWEDFASQTYKELAPVGPIRYRDPFSGAEKTYTPPGGGPGYYRVPTLIGIWATAPFLHNNSLGTFNNNPSTAGRLEAFDDAIERLLWPERRRAPSKQWYWDGRAPARTVNDAWYAGKFKGPPELDHGAAATARRDADGGWIWRMNEENWLQFHGPHVPTLVGGVLGFSPGQMRVVPWVPALVFLFLGTLLLLIGPLIAFRERLAKKVPWLEWLLGPFRYVFALAGFVLAVGALVLVLRYWNLVRLLDVGTRESIWNLKLQAVLIPVVLFGSFGLIFFLHRLPAGQIRARVARAAGVTCLVLAVVSAFGFGRFLSGRGEGLRLGPIPEGVPINVLANFNPEATPDQKAAALDALTDFFLKYQKPDANTKEQRRLEFEERVAPALLNASKCPDFVTDRGHDYEFIRHLTDDEKRELIALLKTF